MRNTLFVMMLLLVPVAAQAQLPLDREANLLKGYVKSVKEETAAIVVKNGKPVEKARELDSIDTFDIAGKALTSYSYSDGKVLIGDTFIYDAGGRLLEKRTVHSPFTYLCDKETYVYDQNGRLSEEICHLHDRGPIGKTLYRYNEQGKLWEQERFPVVEAKLYYSGHSLKRYRYDKNGNLLESESFRKDGDSWVPEKDTGDRYKTTYFSHAGSRSSTALKYDEGGKLALVSIVSDDENENVSESMTYFPDGKIKEGYRWEYKYDRSGNYIKEIDYEWVTEDGKSFFLPTEATYRTIEYFTDREVREFEVKNKNLIKPTENAAGQNTEQEEYAIYSLLLAPWLEKRGGEKLALRRFTQIHDVIDDEPLTLKGFYNRAGDEFPIQQSTVDDFNAKNYRQNSELRQDHFPDSNRIVLVSDAEFREIFASGGDGWKTFHSRYPHTGGLATFSRVGFNKGKTQAIVYRGMSFGFLAGHGSLHILRKRNGKWEIFRERQMWIS